MAIEITKADRDRIIRDTARAGKPAPSWVAADPKLQAIYDAALPTPAGTIDPKKTAGGTPATKGAPATPADRGQGSQGRGAAPASTRRGAGRSATRKPRRTGSGRPGKPSPRPTGPVPFPRALTKAAGGSPVGGLFLAIFLYPIALAIFTNGPAGFGMWLRAKFLNQGGSSTLDPAGSPVRKQLGGFWQHVTPPTGVPGSTAGGAAPGASSSAANAPASVFTPGWADMMKNRQRASA